MDALIQAFLVCISPIDRYEWIDLHRCGQPFLWVAGFLADLFLAGIFIVSGFFSGRLGFLPSRPSSSAWSSSTVSLRGVLSRWQRRSPGSLAKRRLLCALAVAYCLAIIVCIWIVAVEGVCGWDCFFKGSGGWRVWEDVLWQILEVELWADIEEELFLNALSGHWRGIGGICRLLECFGLAVHVLDLHAMHLWQIVQSFLSRKERSRALWAERDRRIPALRDHRKRKIDQCEGSEPRERGFLQLFLQGICGCLQDFRLLTDACRFFGFSGSFLLGFSSKIVGLRLPELGSSAPRTRSVHFRWPLLSAVFLSFLVVLGRYMNRSDLFLVNFYDRIFADDIWTCEVQLHSLSWTWISCFLRQFFCMYWQLIVGSVFGFLRYIVLFLEAIICLYCQLF